MAPLFPIPGTSNRHSSLSLLNQCVNTMPNTWMTASLPRSNKVSIVLFRYGGGSCATHVRSRQNDFVRFETQRFCCPIGPSTAAQPSAERKQTNFCLMCTIDLVRSTGARAKYNSVRYTRWTPPINQFEKVKVQCRYIDREYMSSSQGPGTQPYSRYLGIWLHTWRRYRSV